MAGYQRCISLALLCLLLYHDSLAVSSKKQKTQWKPTEVAYKSTACTSLNSEKAHETFLKRHVSDENAPNTTDLDEWYKYLKARDMIRPTQSFLKLSEKDKVIKVCSNQGGWQYRNKKPTGDKPPRANLCISKDKFKFFTVRLSVKEEEKNLILACDLVGNNKLCRPVHFEPNPTNHNYGDHKEAARGCQGGPAK